MQLFWPPAPSSWAVLLAFALAEAEACLRVSATALAEVIDKLRIGFVQESFVEDKICEVSRDPNPSSDAAKNNRAQSLQVRAYDADEWEAAFGHLRAE